MRPSLIQAGPPGCCDRSGPPNAEAQAVIPGTAQEGCLTPAQHLFDDKKNLVSRTGLRQLWSVASEEGTYPFVVHCNS